MANAMSHWPWSEGCEKHPLLREPVAISHEMPNKEINQDVDTNGKDLMRDRLAECVSELNDAMQKERNTLRDSLFQELQRMMEVAEMRLNRCVAEQAPLAMMPPEVTSRLDALERRMESQLAAGARDPSARALLEGTLTRCEELAREFQAERAELLRLLHEAEDLRRQDSLAISAHLRAAVREALAASGLHKAPLPRVDEETTESRLDQIAESVRADMMGRLRSPNGLHSHQESDVQAEASNKAATAEPKVRPGGNERQHAAAAAAGNAGTAMTPPPFPCSTPAAGMAEQRQKALPQEGGARRHRPSLSEETNCSPAHSQIGLSPQRSPRQTHTPKTSPRTSTRLVQVEERKAEPTAFANNKGSSEKLRVEPRLGSSFGSSSSLTASRTDDGAPDIYTGRPIRHSGPPSSASSGSPRPAAKKVTSPFRDAESRATVVKDLAAFGEFKARCQALTRSRTWRRGAESSGHLLPGSPSASLSASAPLPASASLSPKPCPLGGTGSELCAPMGAGSSRPPHTNSRARLPPPRGGAAV